MMRLLLLTGLVGVAVLARPNQGLSPRGGRGYADVLIPNVPHVQQRPDFCGEACAEMWLKRLGTGWTQDTVFGATGVDPALGRGAWTAELARGLKAIGFETGEVWHAVPAGSREAIEEQWQALHQDLVRQVPSIVCMHYSAEPEATEHFRLVLGYDSARDEVLYHEPAEAAGAYRRMKRDHFLSLWPLKYEPGKWTLVRMRLEPKALVSPPPAAPTAELAQHLRTAKAKVAGEGFSFVLAPPFLVAGDESARAVQARAAGTVEWAARMLRQDFFARDPELIDVWLFKDRKSYESHARALFGEPPTTPFGYFSPTHRALVMNIETGGGTLVHEMVHPYIHENFPACPPWFNEGLASLYEQSTEEEGHIRGLTNWRLAGLKDSIRQGAVPSFRALTAMGSREFYDEDRGTNYAQARYLCYWLQEKGLLVRFYREFTANQAQDPTGFATLSAVLGENDLAAFQRRWEAWVLKLQFPEAR